MRKYIDKNGKELSYDDFVEVEINGKKAQGRIESLRYGKVYLNFLPPEMCLDPGQVTLLKKSTWEEDWNKEIEE